MKYANRYLLFLSALMLCVSTHAAEHLKKNAEGVLVLDSWFFVSPVNSNQRDRDIKATKRIVADDEDFGFMIKFITDRKSIRAKITLTVPSKPENFPCLKCKPGSLTIVDAQTVVVEDDFDRNDGSLGWYWGIGKDDPRGKYSLQVELDGGYSKKWDLT